MWKGYIMKVSSIPQDSLAECNPRRTMFISYVNKFMSKPESQNPVEKAFQSNPIDKPESKAKKLGIENLQEFTIFPKEVKDGQTIITA